MNSVTNNIIKSVIDFPSDQNRYLHIISDNSLSLFDQYISNIDNIFISDINSRNSYLIPQEVALSHNPIEFSSQLPTVSELHINNILYFHNKCPNNFKKEDKFLLRKSLKSSYKIFSSQYVMDSWSWNDDNNSHVLQYGLKKYDDYEKTRSVVVLNISNNASVSMLFEYIKNIFTDAAMIDDIKDENAIKTIQESVVCVEPENCYNCLFGLSCGCNVVTTVNYMKEDGLYTIDSYNGIIQHMNDLLRSYDPKIAHRQKNTILEKYDHKIFEKSFMNLINKIKQEPYIYAKTN